MKAASEPAPVDMAASPDGDAALAIALLAVDPEGLNGAWLRGPPGPLRDGWLDGLRAALPVDAPWRRLPPDVPDSRLLGGLDLAATLRTGRAVAERGVLAAADGGAVVLALAERTAAGVTARLAGVMDRGSVDIQRDGLAMCWPTRFALVALDEGIGDERAPPALCDRLAFTLALDDLPPRAVFDVPPAAEIAAARARLAGVTAAEDVVRALCATAMALGIASPRASLLALRAARAGAALAGRCTVSGEDAAVAARLVLAPRATRVPAEQAESTASPEQPPDATPEDSDQAPMPPVDALEDLVLAAARAALPTALLASLAVAAREASRRGAAAEGRRGGARREARR
ncbi:MAG: magnesium chelatase ATPase subunit D, partial [Acetobacteraceae bacterium]|nr:magnesium chelatase ATPase subunit D [Acetobacteraceae bacterium]